jgi:hypothetical protein
MTFATRHIEKLRAMKVAGDNVSAYIDEAIEYYDQTVNWQLRGKSEWEVKQAMFRRDLSAIRRHIVESCQGRAVGWRYWLEDQLAMETWGEEE